MTVSTVVQTTKEQRVDDELCVVVRTSGDSGIMVLWLAEGQRHRFVKVVKKWGVQVTKVVFMKELSPGVNNSEDI